MKRVICLIVALLLTHSDYCYDNLQYYCAITFQDGSCYEQYFIAPYLELVVRDFVRDSSIESLFITRDL